MDRKTLDKAKNSAKQFCQQLGQYRMPLAWTAINVIDIITGNKAAAGQDPAATPPEKGLYSDWMLLKFVLQTHQNQCCFVRTCPDILVHVQTLGYCCACPYMYLLTVERSQSISSNASGGAADRRSTMLDSAPSNSMLKKKDSYISSSGLPAQSGAEGTKEEGNIGTPLSNSFRPVTLTVQAFFKQV